MFPNIAILPPNGSFAGVQPTHGDPDHLLLGEEPLARHRGGHQTQGQDEHPERHHFLFLSLSLYLRFLSTASVPVTGGVSLYFTSLVLVYICIHDRRLFYVLRLSRWN